jgi:hypothetical protein
MSNPHPNNGPSLSAPTYKKRRTSPAPSPERRQAQQEQDATDAAWRKRFNHMVLSNPDGWYNEHFKK